MDIKVAYGSSVDLTITVASLATSSTLVAGRESNEVDNTTNKYLDYLLSAIIMTGTTPTVNTLIEAWVIAKANDSTWPDVFDGADSAETVTTRDQLQAYGKKAGSAIVTATSNVAYPVCNNVSVAALFGGQMPKKFVVFIVHSTVAALNATGGNHVVSVTPVYATAT